MKNNPRITPKERNLLKGSIRRVFARSELRRAVIDAAIIEHKDPKRPRVTAWCRCNVCGQPEAKYQTVADHIIPVIDVKSSFEEQGADETINRTWCPPENLQAICVKCHNEKTKAERKLRAAHKPKKGKK